MAKRSECECVDPGCDCAGRCHKVATITVYRIDMVDISGTAMCSECADDAFHSGVFSDAMPEAFETRDLTTKGV